MIRINYCIQNLLLVDEKCPIGYTGKLPNCYDIDRFLDMLVFLKFSLHLRYHYSVTNSLLIVKRIYLLYMSVPKLIQMIVIDFMLIVQIN